MLSETPDLRETPELPENPGHLETPGLTETPALSEGSAALVRATLPAVGGALDAISERFYARLFAAHPELLRDLFNRGNQANGAQRQALAGAIAGFATALLDRPGRRPDALLSRIAHKHASLGITRDQYALVHTHLFAAIAEVLGEAVTAEVAAAWGEVYWLMADTLIAAEARLYQEARVADGDVWRPYRVTEVRPLTGDAAAFTVRPDDGGPVPAFRPGQYVSVRVELPDGARQIRQYSLTGTAGDGLGLHFAVKRERGAEGGPHGEVSTHLHDRVRPGDLLRLSAPFGDVTLDAGEGPLLLASAGIGCTPMTGMLRQLVATRSCRPVTVLHADRAPGTHAFRDETAKLAAELGTVRTHFFYETPEGDWPDEHTGRADLRHVELPEGLTAYLCGPLPFMRSLRGQLLDRGVPEERIRYEVFGPDAWQAGV
ncbi:globin domain-containing protein [Streptomyces boluensis]|uniref:nitric oxide dioxygenase n=1 Tax=Streptomyces boluensis TaxID=1775135 RepID=A0A964XNK9_9ACTN|nr:globin domain-containing protein [Streptomyces boluensis]NBE55764.1 hemin transporter [Streptomyces boluensis]